MNDANGPEIDGGWFRTVLGHFPTGVVVITAPGAGGRPAGMAVGSFTSVSLAPPLVAFFPDKSSTSFPKIRAAGSFCVNILSWNQESVCRAFAAKGVDKFANLTWRSAESGSPILDNVVAWIDCDIAEVHEAGDHYIVLGRVRSLDVATDLSPLLFFQGGYGRFSAPSLLADAGSDLLDLLRIADVARPEMEKLSTDFDVECLAVGAVADEIVFVGSSGRPSDTRIRTRVGLRMPFAAPLATPLIAWETEERLRGWMDRFGPHGDEQAAEYRALAQRTRARGWSMVLGSPEQSTLEETLTEAWCEGLDEEHVRKLHDAIQRVGTAGHEPDELEPLGRHDIRYLSAPLFGPDGRVVLMLTLYGLPDRCSVDQATMLLKGLLSTTSALTETLRNST